MISSSTLRWFMLSPCVAAAGATSTARDASRPLTPTPNVSPQRTPPVAGSVDGTEPITGRGAGLPSSANRYGGE